MSGLKDQKHGCISIIYTDLHAAASVHRGHRGGISGAGHCLGGHGYQGHVV